MYLVYCPRHGRRVLLGLSRIRRLVNLSPGVIAVELQCYDGELLLLLAGSQVTHPEVPDNFPL